MAEGRLENEAAPDEGYQICSRCHNRRPKEHFLGGANKTRCVRCRMHDTGERQRYRKRQKQKEAVPAPKTKTSPKAKSYEDFSAAEVNPNVSLANRLKMILRKAMEPDELAARLCNLARSADERIASASLETLMALQGIVVPKRPEEHSEQRFFVMSASLTPKIDVDTPAAEPVVSEPQAMPDTTPKATQRVA